MVGQQSQQVEWKEDRKDNPRNLKRVSCSGWEAFCQGKGTGDCLDQEESHFHINALEILAVFYALKSFMKDQEGVYILILSDNQSVVAHINKMGGTRSQDLIVLTRTTWLWCPAAVVIFLAN